MYLVRREVMFSLFSQVFVCLGRGYPSPRFFPRSSVPGLFPGNTPAPGPMSLLGGGEVTPVQHRGTPLPRQDWFAVSDIPLAVSRRRTFLFCFDFCIFCILTGNVWTTLSKLIENDLGGLNDV